MAVTWMAKILMILFAVSGVAADHPKLHSAFVLIAGGSHSPHFPIPTMDWNDWPERKGEELTGVGMREQYLLGRELRRRHEAVGLISPELLKNQALIRMVDADYIMESGQSFLRGFLLDKVEKLTNEELAVAEPPLKVNKYYIKNIGDNVLPFGMGTLPFHTYYPVEEDVFSTLSCEGANNGTRLALIRSEKVQEIRSKMEARFIEIVRKHYKVEEKMLSFPSYLDLLYSITETNNQRRDTWLSEEEMTHVKNFANSIFSYYKSANETANYFRTSPMLDYIEAKVKEVLQAQLPVPPKKSKLKVSYVFIQDDMMASLLAYLGHTLVSTIPRSSILSFQFFGPDRLVDLNSDDIIVKLLFNDKEIKIKDCEFPECKYQDFVNWIKRIHIKHPEDFCKRPAAVQS